MKLSDNVPQHVPPPADVALLLAQLMQHCERIEISRRKRGPIDVFAITCTTKRPTGDPELELALPRDTLRRITSFDAHAEIVRNLVVGLHDELGI